MNIPTFKTTEHQEEFELVFAEKAVSYIKLLDVVKELMYSKGTGNYSNLPGSCLEVVNDITRSLLYDAETQFKENHPEYKTDEDEIFIPRRTFKEDVTEALKDAMPCALEKHNQEVLAKLECPPCDVLQCADHLTDE